jgi:hypothetical protein
MYDLFEQDAKQYIRVMSLVLRQRIVIPLTGLAPICGNIRLVLDAEQQRVEIQYTVDLKPVKPLQGKPCGLDAGVSEVFTDEQGRRYGVEFGAALAQISDEVCGRGRKRNKLRQVMNKADSRGDQAKAHRMHKFNLGLEKQRAKMRRHHEEVNRQINTTIREVLKVRKPEVVVTEKIGFSRQGQEQAHVAPRQPVGAGHA